MSLQLQAEILVDTYQDLLNLHDWDIKIKVQDDAAYKKKHGKNFGNMTNGCADIFQNKKKARIYIKDDLDAPCFINCIIHEMLHIPLNDLYVTGLTAFKELPESEFKLQTLLNWEWQLETAICRLASGFFKMQEEVREHAEMS